MNKVFYVILFFLACFNYYQCLKNTIGKNVMVKKDGGVEIPNRAFIPIGICTLFHMMVLAICLMPLLPNR